jgi:hypothetical protein
MSTYQRRCAVAPKKSLSALAHDTARLDLQLSELHKLRDRVRQAELSARRSRCGWPDSLIAVRPERQTEWPQLG